PMSKPLTDVEITVALRGLPGWSHQRDALEREYRFPDFRAALAFMVRAGFEAEAVNHHPEWTNVYNRVGVRLTTHDAGGRVTDKDVDLARRFDAVSGV
ncbi:MAG: 4a-hydroxytetrahydrobiopterin dehydratase, partial [Opitutaceae bacterium]